MYKMIFTLFLIVMSGPVFADDFLFEGKTINDFDILLDDMAKSSEVFRLQNGVLDISAIASGWIMTKKTYDYFHFSVEVCYPTDDFVDSGISLWMIPASSDKFGMKCLEVQMKTSDMGDLWGCCGFRIAEVPSRFHSHVEQDTGHAYCRLQRLAIPEKKEKGVWRSIDILCSNKTVQVKIDGIIVNECRLNDIPSGKIGFQTKPYPQGCAPIRYRNAIVHPLE